MTTPPSPAAVRSTVAPWVLHAVVVAVPVAVVVGLAHPVAGLVVGVITGIALTRWRVSGVDERVARRLGARGPGPSEHPRLSNLVESVSMAVGITPPSVHVVDDAAANGVAWGRRRDRGHVAVTTGLLAELGRVELEAVLAHLATDLRDGATEVPTLVVGLSGDRLPGLVRVLAPAGIDDRRPVVTDLAAAAATRFPPGAVAALEKLASVPTAVARSPRALRALWLADPGGPAGHGPAHPSLEDRIDLLREL